MIIPCIKDKCITYPACRNKDHIQCPELRKYYWKMRETHSIAYTWKEMMEQLKGVITINVSKDYNLNMKGVRTSASHNPEEY